MSIVRSLPMFIALISLGALAAPLSIENPADPPKVETWHLREVWRLDNEQDESLPLMGVITQAVATPDGHVLLLDSQMAHILDISPTGTFLRTLSRQGQGPGEMENPNTLFLTADGLVGLVQVYPGKVVFVERDGTPGGNFEFDEGLPMFYWVKPAAGDLVVRGNLPVASDDGGQSVHDNFIGRYSRDGARMVVYHERRTISHFDPPVLDEVAGWFPGAGWAVTSDGSVLIARHRDEYRIDWFEPDGTTRRVIVRPFRPHVRTKEERRKVLDGMRMWGPEGEKDARKTIADTEPAIERIHVLDDGRIWVRTCDAKRDLPDGVFCRYDVYDPKGRFESEVLVAVPVDAKRDHLELLNDGRFLWCRNAKSALNARYAHIEDHGEEGADKLEPEDLSLQVILLERERK